MGAENQRLYIKADVFDATGPQQIVAPKRVEDKVHPRHMICRKYCPLLLVGSALAVSAPLPLFAEDQAFPQRCARRAGTGVLISPREPRDDQSLRVLIVSEHEVPGAKVLTLGPQGPIQAKVLQRGGPPYWWIAEVPRPSIGRYRLALVDEQGKAVRCVRTRVRARRRGRRPPVALDTTAWWPTSRSWNRRRENLYSAWIERLFDAPKTERPTWKPLHQLLRDPERNLLYNYLGEREDGPKARKSIVSKPDCADFPYFLRAYFAWKLRLPFGYRQCSRGSARRPPRCNGLKSNVEPPLPGGGSPAKRFSLFLRRRVSYVHSAAGRTAPDDDETDLYPLKLSRKAIRPGTVYVDPGGHLLVVARWFPQQGGKSGQLFAAESQPDQTVGRKRFWRGAFLFNPSARGGGSGFKAFRPLVMKEGQVVALKNDELKASRDYRGTFSKQQYRLGMDGFYERVDQLINPEPLAPRAAYEEQINALHELVQKRIDSVATGEAYMKSSSYKVVPMPRGKRIFQTSGPWEDYSTPSRDFRLLVAIHEVLRFPQKVVAHPKRFALPADKDATTVARELETLRQRLGKTKKVRYKKSDGSEKELTILDVISRRKAMEMAYNPNDCVELRWGATGKELESCARHAPAEQRARMSQYRPWFAKRLRPGIH